MHAGVVESLADWKGIMLAPEGIRSVYEAIRDLFVKPLDSHDGLSSQKLSDKKWVLKPLLA
jgi:hypothetical protein